MVVSESGTILSEYTGIQRIKTIIDGDPRIKSEIAARMKDLLGASKAPTLKYVFQPFPLGVRVLKQRYTDKELNMEIEKTAREKAVYAQYIEDAIFASKVNSALA